VNATYRRMVTAVIALAALIVGTWAHAAKVATIWDPPFGGSLNGDLAWFGQAEFTLDDSCLTNANPGSGSVPIYDAACPMALTSATVTLYHESVGYNPLNPSTFQTAFFGFTNLNGPGVDKMAVANVNGLNSVVGIQTRPYEFLASLPNGLFAPNGYLWMWWTMPNGIDPVMGSTSNLCIDGFWQGPCNQNDPQYDSNPAPIALLTTCYDDGRCTVISSVPEPGTLGLALGALGAGWVARRRKKKTA
jgi:hypothetical protein